MTDDTTAQHAPGRYVDIGGVEYDAETLYRFITSNGFSPCNMPACNCNSFHANRPALKAENEHLRRGLLCAQTCLKENGPSQALEIINIALKDEK